MNPPTIRADWPAPAGVRAFCTTRRGGFSTGAWESLNLGSHCGDEPENVSHNRRLLEAALPSRPVWLRQVHGDRVLRHEDAAERVVGCDALVSFRPGRACVVLTADCLPVLFCNRAGNRVAAAHAGWRGLAAGILQNTVAALDESPGELMAWLGPAIGPQAYEVGNDVVEAFGDGPAAGFKPRGGRWLMDLYRVARTLLERQGVHDVFGGGFCTYSEPQRFYSYRRDGVTGRMASVIWWEPSP
jgi:YfiH family protein